MATGKKNIEVKSSLTKLNTNTIQDILDSGSKDDVLNFIRKRNIHDPNVFALDQILWLCSEDEKFFDSL